MPYLNEKFKAEIEKVTELTSDACYYAGLDDEHFAGAINYQNFVIAKEKFSGVHSVVKYWKFAMWTGTMILCILEVWWRLIRPYEAEAILKNGDV